jgi:hypothetical protein
MSEPITTVDANYISGLTQRVAKHAQAIEGLRTGLATATQEQRELAQAEAKRLGLSNADRSQAPVYAYLFKRAQDRVTTAIKAAEPTIDTHVTELRRIEAEMEQAATFLTPRAAFQQRLYRMDSTKRDERLRYAGAMNETDFVELLRQATIAKDAETLAACFVIAGTRPEWKSAQSAMAKAPNGDLDVLQAGFSKLRGQVQFVIAQGRAALRNQAVAPDERIAFGLSQGDLDAEGEAA